MFNYTETGIISADPFVKKARLGNTRLLICPVALSAGGSVDAVYYPNAGEDTWPCKNDVVALIRIGGFAACFGAKPPGDPSHNPGEREFFGRNADGEHKSSILLNQYGDIITKNDRDNITEIGRHNSVDIKENSDTHIGGDSADTIDGNVSKIIGGDEERYVDGDKTDNISGKSDLSIAGDYNMSVGGSLNMTVGGSIKINGATIHLN